MNDRFRLNGELIRTYLEQECRKASYFEQKLGVSESLIRKMLAGRIPKARTLTRLAAILGVQESHLLIPKDRAA
jgi:transcriptional regulator with XRE-family HTH domain